MQNEHRNTLQPSNALYALSVSLVPTISDHIYAPTQMNDPLSAVFVARHSHVSMIENGTKGCILERRSLYAAVT